MNAFSDSLGAELGGYFRAALRENRLPKTTYLLGNGYLARAGGIASSTFVEKEYFGYERPFVVAPKRIKKYQSGPRNFYGKSKAFPSGHTNQATWVTTLLAMQLPELAHRSWLAVPKRVTTAWLWACTTRWMSSVVV